MSKTACCFVALGISFAAFAAACGDDDGGGGGTGGNGGNGASGGSGGGAGTANNAGEGGTAGMAGSGTAGSGTAGSGTAGSGTAGSGTAGSGSAGAAGDGSVEGDAGPDSGTGPEPDSGIVDAGNQGPADSGVNGNCPNFATSTALAAPQDNQPVEIVRVTIDPGGTTATVVLRGNDSVDVGGFTLGDIQFICNGPEDADCTDPSDLPGTLPAQLALNAELALTGVPIADAAEGELVLATGLPSDVASGTFAYLAYGANFDSVAPAAGGALLSWEARAAADGFWTLLDRIPVTTENTLLLGGNTGDPDNGDTSKAAGFGVCTADQF